jgi:hypothetical protein
MPNDEKIDKIEEISKSTKAKTTAIDEAVERVAPDKEHFNSLIRQDASQPRMEAADQQTKASLMDQVRDLNKKVDGISKASPDSVLAQAHDAIQRMEEVKHKLATPELELKPSVQTLLRNKLSHIDENLKIALNRTGLEYITPEQTIATGNSPIEKFLGYLTHAQHQLNRLGGEVEQMHVNGKELAPGAMLALQVKVNYISQEMEFFTSLLNKALESTKTIMNVQV